MIESVNKWMQIHYFNASIDWKHETIVTWLCDKTYAKSC